MHRQAAQAGLLKNLVGGRLYVACVSVNPEPCMPSTAYEGPNASPPDNLLPKIANAYS